jgi:hypothetical protein
MEKVDRLGWADGITFSSYGVRLGIRVNDPQVLDRVRKYLPPGIKPSSSPVVDRLFSLLVGGSGSRPGVRRFNLLYENHVRIARVLDLEQVFETLESSLRLYVAETAHRRLFVHAGVVGWRGKAIVIPGRSFSGKTTLVAELVRAGATYYSDEYAVFDAKGRVHPFPKPLSIRLSGEIEQQEVAVEELGGRTGIKPLPVGLVLMSRYRAGARWRPRQLSAGVGALELLSNTVAARKEPAKALNTLERVVSSAPVLKGVRGEASEVARAILENVEEGTKSVPLPVNDGKLSAVQRRV